MTQRVLLTLVAVLVALGLIIAGLTLLCPPVGLIAAGIGLLGFVTFDPAKVGRVTWPR